MREIIERESVYLWYYITILFEQIAPFWVIGMLVGSTISVFGKKRIFSLFSALHGKRLGILTLVPASLLGIASPLCMYGTIPIAASFSQKGVKDDWLAAFMMSSILLNPQLLIYSAALGTSILWIRLISCFLCGIGAGLVVRFFYSGASFFNFTGFSENQNTDTDSSMFVCLLKNIARNIRATGGWFLLGIVLSAIFQRAVPAQFIESLFGSHSGFGVLMAATIGVPLYACGGATIPLLALWLQKGMSLGAAAAFMITGPATKITNLGALKIVLGAKRFALFLAFILLFALASGLLVNAFFLNEK